MGDAGRQLSHRGHFLGLYECPLHPFLFGNVLRDACDPVNGSGGVPDGKSAVADPAKGPVRPDDAVFFIVGSQRLFWKRAYNASPIFRMDGFQKRHRVL